MRKTDARVCLYMHINFKHFMNKFLIDRTKSRRGGGGGEGVLPYMGYIGICSGIGHGF